MTHPTIERRLLGVEEVETLTGLSRWRLWALARTGRIPTVRVGRLYRFDRVALDRWIEKGGDGRTESAGAA